jgi:hypothetical protein
MVDEGILYFVPVLACIAGEGGESGASRIKVRVRAFIGGGDPISMDIPRPAAQDPL